VIELDGQYHHEEEMHLKDADRDAELKSYGLTVLRFTEKEVRKDMWNVLKTIETYIADYIA